MSGNCSWGVDPYDEDKKSGRETRNEVLLFLHNKRVYGIFNFERDVQKWSEPYKGVIFEDYSYWNNTDPPDDVPRANWRKRGKIWDEIFKDSWSASEVGLTVDFSYQYSLERSFARFYRSDDPKIDKTGPLHERLNVHQELIDAMSDPMARAMRLHSEVSFSGWALKDFDPNSKDYSKLFRHIGDLEKGRNEVFNKARDFLAQHVLPHKLTPDLLLMNQMELKPSSDELFDRLAQMEIPQGLCTPAFEQRLLNHKVDPSANPSSPKPKM